jgi:hypothetical protein
MSHYSAYYNIIIEHDGVITCLHISARSPPFTHKKAMCLRHLSRETWLQMRGNFRLEVGRAWTSRLLLSTLTPALSARIPDFALPPPSLESPHSWERGPFVSIS